jgi:heme exporter protein B
MPAEAVTSAPVLPRASALQAFRLVLLRDLRLAFRRPAQIAQPLAFFAVVATLFPLALSPELARLRALAHSALWICALLASLLALEQLFREDQQDGTLEQYALSGQSLTVLLLAKTVAHWLLTGLPLAIMAPLVSIAFGVTVEAMPGIIVALLLGSVTLSLIGAIGAGLTLGVKRGGVLLSLLTLPLAVPVLIFGARATELAIRGESATAPLYLLAAMAVLSLTLAPLAAAAAVRVSIE